MSQVKQISWLILGMTAFVGLILIWAGLKLSASKFADKRDSLGVRYAERSLFLLLNGLFLFALSMVGALIKLAA